LNVGYLLYNKFNLNSQHEIRIKETCKGRQDHRKTYQEGFVDYNMAGLTPIANDDAPRAPKQDRMVLIAQNDIAMRKLALQHLDADSEELCFSVKAHRAECQSVFQTVSWALEYSDKRHHFISYPQNQNSIP
jgi:hypothetical protein